MREEGVELVRALEDGKASGELVVGSVDGITIPGLELFLDGTILGGLPVMRRVLGKVLERPVGQLLKRGLDSAGHF